MDSAGGAGIPAKLRAALVAEGDAESVLRNVIRELDLLEDPELGGLALARAVIAIGPAMIHAGLCHPGVQATLDAASAYVAAPSDSTELAYFGAATDSYPFGPGEGCYSILSPPRDHGEPGSGCRSGAGTLLSIGYEVGMASVLDAVRAALLPWLDGLEITDDTKRESGR